MVTKVNPIGESRYDPSISSGDRLLIEQANFSGGNNDESITKNLIRFIQDLEQLRTHNGIIQGFLVSVSSVNNRFLNIGAGSAIINGKWISNTEAITDYQTGAATNQDYYLYLELTESVTNPPNPEGHTVSYQQVLKTDYIPSANRLLLAEFNLPLVSTQPIVVDAITDVNDLMTSIRGINTILPIRVTSNNKPVNVMDVRTWTDSLNAHLIARLRLNQNTAITIGDILVLWRDAGNRIHIRVDDFTSSPHSHRHANGDDVEFPAEGGAIHLTNNKFLIGDGDNTGFGQTLTGAIKSTSAGVITLRLNEGQINVGSSANEGVPVTMSGDATITNAGVVTVSNSTALEKKMDSNSHIENGDDVNEGRILSILYRYYITLSSTTQLELDDNSNDYYDNVFRYNNTININDNRYIYVKYSLPLPGEKNGKRLTIRGLTFNASAGNGISTNIQVRLLEIVTLNSNNSVSVTTDTNVNILSGTGLVFNSDGK